jgi:uncharacterized protein (TIGR00369 family)
MPMALTDLQSLLETLFAPWVRDLGLEVHSMLEDGVRLRLPVRAQQVHVGGVLCGQAMMAAADTALVIAASRVLGGFRPLTTVQQQTSFLRPVPAGTQALDVDARILKSGRSLLFGEARIALPDGKLAAHVTSTSALL